MKYVPLNKRSKKEQKAYYASRRQTWGTTNPCSRTMDHDRVYNRSKQKCQLQKELG